MTKGKWHTKDIMAPPNDSIKATTQLKENPFNSAGQNQIEGELADPNVNAPGPICKGPKTTVHRADSDAI